jgi:hypothetical protein
VPKDDDYSFRLYCNANGVIDIEHENDEDIFKHTVVNNTVYTGIGIGRYGLFLDSGIGAELKGLAVF